MHLFNSARYSESVDHEHSKTGLRMFLRPLVMFLWSFEVLAKLRNIKGRATKKNVALIQKVWF